MLRTSATIFASSSISRTRIAPPASETMTRLSHYRRSVMTGITFPGARRPERQRWVSDHGLRLAVWEWGDAGAPPLLLAHGGFDFAGTYDVFAPLLADAGWRVVSWDARGHGDSDHAVLYS